MFHRQRKNTSSMQQKSLKDLTRIMTAAQMLADERRQNLLGKINELMDLDASRYASLGLSLIESLAYYCQSLPETSNSYYSQPGGLLDHALNRTEAALSLFKEFTLPEHAESLSEEQRLWQYALYSAALLQGIGKLVVDYQLNLFDSQGQLVKEWNPLLERMIVSSHYYSYVFQSEPEILLRRRINLLLARTLMPSGGFAWIASNRQVLAVWLALLNEDERSAGTLGAILIRADAIAIQRYLQEFMRRAGLSSMPGRIGTFAGGSENLLAKEQALGVEFIEWLLQALHDGQIIINQAPLFMVPGGMLMCQEMFQLFVREHPDYKNWQAVQNGFLALGLHQRAVDGSVISRFEHGQNQMHSGVVLAHYAIALPESVSVQQQHSSKIETVGALDLINAAQYHSHLTQHHGSVVAPVIERLNTAGQWQVDDVTHNPLQPGARTGG